MPRPYSASPKSRPRVAQQWPRTAEAQRKQINESASDALELLDEARQIMRDNPLLAELQIADAMRLCSDIKRLTVEARIGVLPPAEQEETE